MLAAPAFPLVPSLFRRQQSAVVVAETRRRGVANGGLQAVWPRDESETGGNWKALVISRFVFVVGERATRTDTVLYIFKPFR